MNFGLETEQSMYEPIFDGKYFCCEMWELLGGTLFPVMKPIVREKQRQEKERAVVIFMENPFLLKLGKKYDRQKYNFRQENPFPVSYSFLTLYTTTFPSRHRALMFLMFKVYLIYLWFIFCLFPCSLSQLSENSRQPCGA